MKDFYLVQDIEPHKGLLFFRYKDGDHAWYSGYLSICCKDDTINNWRFFNGFGGKNSYGIRETELTLEKLINMLCKNRLTESLPAHFKSILNQAFEFVLKE